MSRAFRCFLGFVGFFSGFRWVSLLGGWVFPLLGGSFWGFPLHCVQKKWKKIEENGGSCASENYRKSPSVPLLAIVGFFFLAARVSFSLPVFSLPQAAEKLKERLALRAREMKRTYSLYISYKVFSTLYISYVAARREK